MSLDFENGSNEWVDLGSSLASLQNRAAATVCFWTNPESFSTADSPISISTGAGSVTDSRCSIKQLTGPNRWLSSSRRLDGGGFDTISGGSPGTGVIQHIAAIMQWASQSHELFLNGVSIASSSPAGWTGNTSNTVSQASALAANDPGTADYYDGKLQDVRVYDRALSTDELLTIYAARGHDTNREGLINQWPLMQGYPGQTASGASSILDVCLAAAHGTPTNTPTYAEALVAPHRRRVGS